MEKPFDSPAFDKAVNSGCFRKDQLGHLYSIIKEVMRDEKYKPSMPAFFTVKEYAARLQVTEYTVRTWITEELLEGMKLNGQKLRISRAAAEKFERIRLTSTRTVSNS